MVRAGNVEIVMMMTMLIMVMMMVMKYPIVNRWTPEEIQRGQSDRKPMIS